MRRIKLTIEYDGKNFCGWQRQENGISIQESVENAIFLATTEKVVLYGSGRTDAGVHSLGQIAHFDTDCTIPQDKIAYALNVHLPTSITVVKSEEVSNTFHARFNAKKKTYLYNVHCGEFPSPIKCHSSTFVKGTLNLKKMREASKELIGENDYIAFSASGSNSKTTVRIIYNIEIIKKDNNFSFYITGNGFLYNMVRIIVGTLIYVGKGKITKEKITNILQSKKRENAGPTMPAEGLILYEVFY